MASVTKRHSSFFARYVDPIRNARSMEGQVLLAETVAKIVAVIITSVGFYIWGADVASQYADNIWIQRLTGVLFAAVAAWITDFAFSEFLENSMFQFFRFWKFDWFENVARDGWYITLLLKPFRWVVVTGIVILLFYADYNAVYTLRSPIANAKKEKVERVNFAALDAAQKQRIKDQVGPIDQEIEQVRSDIKKAEHDVTASNAGLSDLSRKGNKWAPGELKKLKDKATKADRKRLKTLQEQRDKVYASVSGTSEQQRSIALADDQTAQQTESENKAAISTLFTQFGIGSKILTMLFRLFLVINFLINTPNLDANNDGRVDGEDVTAAAQKPEQRSYSRAPAYYPTGADGSSGPNYQPTQRDISYRSHDATGARTAPSHTPEYTVPGPAYRTPKRRIAHKQQQPSDTRTAETNTPEHTVPGPTVPQENTVEQCSTQEQQGTVASKQDGTAHTQNSVLADVSQWKKRAQQCYDRSIHQQRPEYKQDNHQRYMCYSIMLQCVGVAVQQDGDKLIFTDPDRYTINDDVVSVITEQQDRLARVGQRRVGA